MIDTDEYELTDEKCPECGAALYVITVGTAPDDYTQQYQCLNCNYIERI